MKERLSELLRRSEHPVALVVASIAESTVVPIPIEVLVTPMMATHPDRKWRIATWTLIGSIIGTALMYLLGVFAFDTLGTFLIERFGWQEPYRQFEEYLRTDGVLAVAVVSITAIPLVVAAVGAGAGGMNFLAFLAAVTVTRAIRYYGLAVLVVMFGKRARKFVEYLSSHPMARAVAIALSVLGAALLVWLGVR